MPDINIPGVPSSTLLPLFYAATDNSQANTDPSAIRAILIAPMLAAGSATPNVPVICAGASDAIGKCGLGSIGADMAASYRANDAFGEFWLLPVPDNSAGQAATGSIVFTGTATANGTLNLNIGDQLVQVAVSSGMTAAALATALAAQIEATPTLVVSAAVDGVNTAKVDLTCNHKGLVGNDTPIVLNALGAAGGQTTPAGVTVAITPFAGGTAAPSLTTALANLGTLAFEVFISPFNDSASMASMAAFLGNANGRWAAGADLYGHHVTAYRGSYSGLTTWGLTNNDPHTSVLAMDAEPTPLWRSATDLGAQAILSVAVDAAQPIRDVPLATTTPAQPQAALSPPQRNSVLIDGLSTYNGNVPGVATLEKMVTTYQLNAYGVADNSYRDAETLFNLAYCLRQLKSVVTSTLSRCKLAADAPGYSPPPNVVTPSTIRALIIAQYQTLCDDGFAQQPALFAQGLLVQINSLNPNRVDVLYPETLIQRLDLFAVLAQFRLR